MMRALLAGVGALVLICGLLFLAQGTGLFPSPRASITVAADASLWRGAGLALLGAAMILFSRSLRAR